VAEVNNYMYHPCMFLFSLK